MKWSEVKYFWTVGSFLEFFDWLLYRIFARKWGWFKGYSFHRSTLCWIVEDGEVHTRCSFLLPRLKEQFPSQKTVTLEFEIHDQDGKRFYHWVEKNLSTAKPYVFDSKTLRGPVNGSLLVKQYLSVSDRVFHREVGQDFAPTHTYIDYYKEGSFISTVHDYSAFLPDQVFQRSHVGMIPVCYTEQHETFIVLLSAASAVKKGDLTANLYNHKGESQSQVITPMNAFSTRKILISDLFQNVSEFLDDKVGQLVVEGIFRQVLTRIGYGLESKIDGSFSLDHCYYSYLDNDTTALKNSVKIEKGTFNPFLILGDSETSTSIVLFHHETEEQAKIFDLNIYDKHGKRIIQYSPYVSLSGNQTCKVDFNSLLLKNNIALPFLGHGEMLYHNAGSKPLRALDLHLEVKRKNHIANVTFGAKIWNPPRPVRKTKRDIIYGCRVICDKSYTTNFAITNCSYSPSYAQSVDFELALLADGQIVDRGIFSIGPEATLYEPIEYFFPNAQKHLSPFNGIGLLSYWVMNSNYLVTVFLTEDRKSKNFSLEHTLAFPKFLLEDSTFTVHKTVSNK